VQGPGPAAELTFGLIGVLGGPVRALFLSFAHPT
jgi:hypothetical protein